MKFTGLLIVMSVSLAAQGPPYSQRPREPQTGKASLEGTVIDASTREPVKKASVTLMGSTRLNAVTDASGHFAFRQLPAGQYSIQAQSEKYPFVPPGVGEGNFLSFSLAADEQKQDVGLTLTPGASIQGRVVDEDGSPMARCDVTAMQFRDTDAGRSLDGVGSAQSDDLGEYRISKLRSGKYYIMARCFRNIPLPHAFIRRSAAMDVPVLTYSPQFYPGVPDPAGATRVEARANASTSGIDFRMPPATGVTIRGHAGPLPADRNLEIALQPKNSVWRAWQLQNARVSDSTGEFRFPNVVPGSYELIAMGTGDGHSYFANVPIELGAMPLDPIEVALSAAPSISGTISIEGDGKRQINSLQVRMEPWDQMQRGMGDSPHAEVQSDGTFTLKSVAPGRWRLSVSGAPGYLKSMVRGDQEVTPEDFETGAAAGVLKITIGTKFAELNVSLTAPPLESARYFAIIWGEHGYRNLQVIGPGLTKLGMPPGKFHLCAVAGSQPFALLENSTLRKALESVCEGVEVSEGGSASVRMHLVTAEDLKRMMEKLDE